MQHQQPPCSAPPPQQQTTNMDNNNDPNIAHHHHHHHHIHPSSSSPTATATNHTVLKAPLVKPKPLGNSDDTAEADINTNLDDHLRHRRPVSPPATSLQPHHHLQPTSSVGVPTSTSITQNTTPAVVDQNSASTVDVAASTTTTDNQQEHSSETVESYNHKKHRSSGSSNNTSTMSGTGSLASGLGGSGGGSGGALPLTTFTLQSSVSSSAAAVGDCSTMSNASSSLVSHVTEDNDPLSTTQRDRVPKRTDVPSCYPPSASSSAAMVGPPEGMTSLMSQRHRLNDSSSSSIASSSNQSSAVPSVVIVDDEEEEGGGTEKLFDIVDDEPAPEDIPPPPCFAALKPTAETQLTANLLKFSPGERKFPKACGAETKSLRQKFAPEFKIIVPVLAAAMRTLVEQGTSISRSVLQLKLAEALDMEANTDGEKAIRDTKVRKLRQQLDKPESRSQRGYEEFETSSVPKVAFEDYLNYLTHESCASPASFVGGFLLLDRLADIITFGSDIGMLRTSNNTVAHIMTDASSISGMSGDSATGGQLRNRFAMSPAPDVKSPLHNGGQQSGSLQIATTPRPDSSLTSALSSLVPRGRAESAGGGVQQPGIVNTPSSTSALTPGIAFLDRNSVSQQALGGSTPGGSVSSPNFPVTDAQHFNGGTLPKFYVSGLNVLKLVSTSVRIASKLIEVSVVDHGCYANAARVSPATLASMEAKMLVLLEWRGYISPSDIEVYFEKIKGETTTLKRRTQQQQPRKNSTSSGSSSSATQSPFVAKIRSIGGGSGQ